MTPPKAIFNAISIQLDSSGVHTITAAEISRIAAGSRDDSGIVKMTVTPSTFGFCNVGVQSVTLRLTDGGGNITDRSGPIEVLAPSNLPQSVYVDARNPAMCAIVGFPNGQSNAIHFVGFDAFNTIQAGVDHVAEYGFVYVAAGTYIENIVVNKPLFLIGPNAGCAGGAAERRPEARIIPQRSDPENTPIISVETDDIVIDGLFLDGNNPNLTGGYNANGVPVHAAAGVQNGSYPDLADVEGITIRNNVITNISYDGVCLDRYQYFGSPSAWNYVCNNKMVNMWEGLLTYGVDSVIANNVISNVTHGMGVHCVTTAAPKSFVPLVASNTLWIAQWWPQEIQPIRAPGIWINFRRERASPIDVVGNIVNTPVAAPSFKSIIGLFALTIDGGGKINFIDNTVNGNGNCTVGLLASSCWSNRSVKLLGGRIRDIQGTGVLADTMDAKWGPGNCALTVSNAEITLKSGGVGVLALQEPGTPVNSALVEVMGSSRISRGHCGVQVRGTNASASVVGTFQQVSANDVGIDIDGGRALLEGNILTNNRIAAVTVENGGLVDAGNCAGVDRSGLGTGTGPNGASAGLNDFSGYGFDQLEPWAIKNSGGLPVTADRNIFNPGPGENIGDAISGPVIFSDSGILNVRAPPAVQVECFGQVPVAARTVEEFAASGGLVSSGSAARISSRDVIVTNRPGLYTVSRRYTVGGGCTQEVSCDQIITARDDQPPILHCSENIVQPVDPGCDYATVTFTNLAADSCGELLGSWVPVSTGRFPIGTNTVIVIATDLAMNSTACSFDIAVIGPPTIKGNLRILGCSGGIASLELTGRSGYQFAILTSTNLTDWVRLCSNVAPFTFMHTNADGPGYRFYRSLRLP